MAKYFNRLFQFFTGRKTKNRSFPTYRNPPPPPPKPRNFETMIYKNTGMKITNKNKLFFFIKDKSNEEFDSRNLTSYMAIPLLDGKVKFKRIEEISLFFHKDIKNYEVGSFRIEFGRNDCHYLGVSSEKELKQYMLSDSFCYNFETVSKSEYLKFRKDTLALYERYQFADFSKLEIGCELLR